MARSKSKLHVAVEYYPLRGFLWLLKILPWTLSLLLSWSLLRLVVACLPKRRKITDDNLAQSFPELRPQDRQEISQAALLNLSRSVTVFSKIPKLGPDDWSDLVRLEGMEHVQAALSRGRGAITFTAHYGCWEAMAAYLPRPFPSAIIVRPFDNPRIETVMEGVRALGGGLIIPRQRALTDGLKALRRNMLLGILVDQNFAQGSLFVNFLGRPAATTPIVSILARRTGCAVLPLHNVWENGRIHIIFEPAITLSRQEDRDLAVAEDTQAMTAIVESWPR